MRRAVLVFALYWPWLLQAAAQTAESHNTINAFLFRTAERLQGPHVVTYRLGEWEQIRGRWILPDIGYYDTGYGKDQIWFAGGGAYIVRRPRIEWYQEFYLSQEIGPQSQNRRAFWIWPVVDTQLRPHLSAEIAAYPTIPLDRAQRWGMDVDRAKIEMELTAHWVAGAGYSGGICSTRTWQNDPFVALTRKTHYGNFEFWMQRIPGGSQLQMRYSLVRGER
jgi:hypothetical protein